MSAEVTIRPAAEADLTFLRQMLYEAAYWKGAPRPDLEGGLAYPVLSKLLAGWGRAGDRAVVAEAAEEPVGAAWLRFWSDVDHSFGYVAPEVPEIGIGVAAAYRQRGIGRLLMTRLLGEAARAGTLRVSLSVERDNPALHLYDSLGFETVGELGSACTMVAETRHA